ncbi:hypothetical protein BDV95DRAFT_598126 [Massariosphaeria phaeospora]|uniref:Uncharacterized protein n=1 Tax=Massariosphaeria phaeospora TaxID=100035 RepID=A0A7C8M9I6_9PLEO|nr:hypothetical protein BDV95DRAFT_598126 [Massariosphaeria phaeospora]
MPSFSRSSRAYSFPPCIDSVEFAPPSDTGLPDIDEDPFAHFLTPVTEEDDPYSLELSAGIHDGPRTSKTSKFKTTVADKWARYVKNNHVSLHDRYHDASADETEDEESFMQLDDDRLLAAPHTVTQLTGPPTPRITITQPTRGRAQEPITRKPRPRNRTSRTLSGHRHSWREPSPDLFTVDESEEEEQLPRRSKMKKTKDGAERRRSSRPRLDMIQKSRL